MDLPIPIQVLYAGLGGTLLALIVATATNRWQLKVFFLLALRLAIGWHFLFEGLYKVNTHLVGPSGTNREFTGKPYFEASPTGVGAYMRGRFGDPQAVIDEKVKVPPGTDTAAFDKLPAEGQAAACPAAVAKALDTAVADAEAAVTADAEYRLQGAVLEDTKARIRAEADRLVKNLKALDPGSKAYRDSLTAAKAAYARWVYGVDARPCKVKFVTGEVQMTAPQRLDHLDWLRKEAAAAEGRHAAGLGNGYGTEAKRAAEVRADLVAAEADLARDADAFVADLKKNVLGADYPAPSPDRPVGTRPWSELSPGQQTDRLTKWFLVAVGGCLMVGLFTRVACLAAAGFLLVTYLAAPPFPWYPPPPPSEGNPVFVNKNAIEMLALLALACLPTGRWLGLDAVLMPLLGFRKPAEA
ncbi:MAG: hypothetical protein K2X87_00375 [Gemmataceae bacterium]|nr:hypothetical protein [Gemmataceae bacterium]